MPCKSENACRLLRHLVTFVNIILPASPRLFTAGSLVSPRLYRATRLAKVIACMFIQSLFRLLLLYLLIVSLLVDSAAMFPLFF